MIHGSCKIGIWSFELGVKEETSGICRPIQVQRPTCMNTCISTPRGYESAGNWTPPVQSVLVFVCYLQFGIASN